MNKMKQLIFIIIGFIVAALVIGGTLMSVKNDIKGQVENGTAKSSNSSQAVNSNIQNDIVFINVTTKYVGGKTSSGYILDKNGLRYNFNFSENGEMTPEQIFAEAEKLIKTTKGEFYLSSADMSILYDQICRIDTNAKFDEEKNKLEDNTITMYGVLYKDGKTSLIKIYSHGYLAEIPQDPIAQSIEQYFIPKENKDKEESLINN